MTYLGRMSNGHARGGCSPLGPCIFLLIRERPAGISRNQGALPRCGAAGEGAGIVNNNEKYNDGAR